MSSRYAPLIPATLDWNAHGAPLSPSFGDIYYAGDEPLAQARAVFLRGNGLPQRWQGLQHFTVLETGFGLGHNFLALWQAWRDDPHRCARLHVASIEAHPLMQADMVRLAHRLRGPERVLAQALAHAWPPLVPGIHRLEFEGGTLSLTLAFGDVQRMAHQLDLSFDACFLDGFSPRLNPAMWTPRVLGQVARMAKPAATLATWCSAGQVRRDLQNAGFLIERRPGFGTKRHQIVGRLRPKMGRMPPSRPHHVLIVGSGFAGAAMACSMAARGHEVTVVDPALAEGLAGNHRGHDAAALTPVVSRDDDYRSRMSRAGVSLARLRWGSLPEAAGPTRCGTLQLLPSDQHLSWQLALDRLAFPRDYLRWLDAAQGSTRCGLRLASGGIWHEEGHLVRPAQLLHGLLSTAGLNLRANVVARLAATPTGAWQAWDSTGAHLVTADAVVLANSWAAPRLLASIPHLPLPRRLHGMRRLAGQLSYFAHADYPRPRCVLVGEGLCLPHSENGLIAGSTYVADTTLCIISTEGHQENRQKLAGLLECDLLQQASLRPFTDGWAGWRVAASDHLPVIGQVPAAAGLWVACGFGSRGLTWSALAAEIISAKINCEPVPLERELSKRIAPL